MAEVVKRVKGLTRKGGKKNRKFGRNEPGKRAQSNANQRLRTAANKARHILRDKQEKERQVRKLVRRSKRRMMQQSAQPQVTE